MVNTDDTRRTTDDGRRTTPRVWHKLPTGELKITLRIIKKKMKNLWSKMYEILLLGDPSGACSSYASSQISETAEATVVKRIVVNTSCQTTPKTDKYPDVTKTQEGFRHTKADSQRILNGSRKKPKTVNETESGPNVRHSPIVGSSQSPLSIKAATNTSFDQPFYEITVT